MLNKKQQEKVLKLLKYSDEEIKDLLDSEEEKDLTPKEVKVFTNDEYEKITENISKNNEPKQMKAAKEIVIKDMKEMAGLEFEGKDMKDFLKHYKAKAVEEAGVKPNELAANHEAEKKEWQQKYQDLQGKLEGVQNEYNTVKTDISWKSAFPKGDKIHGDDDLLILAKSKVKARQEGDKTVFSYNGQDLKDDMHNYMSDREAMSHVFSQEKWIKEPTTKPKGEGFDSSGSRPNTHKTLGDVQKEMKQKGINPLTSEGRDYIAKAKEANPELSIKD